MPQVATLPTRPTIESSQRDAMPGVLVATLGAEAQVTPLAVQLLKGQGYGLERVVVLHTRPNAEPILSALTALRESFAGQPEWPGLDTRELPLQDVLDEQDIEKFGEALYGEIKVWLGQGYQMHLLLAGGRKPMAMLGVTIAQMLFGPDDRVWYLYSNERLRQSGRALLQAGDRAWLVPIPLVRWSIAPPILTDIGAAQSPLEALAGQQERLLARKRRFLTAELSAAEREVAEMVIRTGATDADIARALHKSVRTVSHQLATVYDKLRVFLEVRPDVRVDRHTLISEFAPLLPLASGEDR